MILSTCQKIIRKLVIYTYCYSSKSKIDEKSGHPNLTLFWSLSLHIWRQWNSSFVDAPYFEGELHGLSKYSTTHPIQYFSDLLLLEWLWSLIPTTWESCPILDLGDELFFLSLLCQKWVLWVLKDRFSLKFHLNQSFLTKFINKTSFRTLY